nr:MAG TPA: Regulatory protein-modification, helix-turn-helix, transcriptional regulator, DNA [Caudoviricetes sp.]
MHNKVVLFLSVNKHVIQNINSFLEECGKTGADMSRDLGLSNATYSNWNLYKTNVSKKYFPLIADWLSKQLSRKIFVSDLTAVSSTAQQKKPTAQGDGQEVSTEDIEKWIDNGASEAELKKFIARASAKLVEK